MEKSPYTFDPKNPRIVLNVERPSNVTAVAGLLFAGSVYFYSKRFFRCDKNLVNLVAFSVASVPASYSYANFFLNSAETEAGIINNQKEAALWPSCSQLFNAYHFSKLAFKIPICFLHISTIFKWNNKILHAPYLNSSTNIP